MFQSPSRWGRCCIAVLGHTYPIKQVRFSPLLDGDGVASIPETAAVPGVSGFSPLLDGDGVASSCARCGRNFSAVFQSPSRWGRCCIMYAADNARADALVSVPFSMGTVLHRRYYAENGTCELPFQSPSRWGRCCIMEPPRQKDKGTLVSVPFSMGTVLHLARVPRVRLGPVRVSVPFSMGTVLHPCGSARWTARIHRFQSPSRWGRCCIADGGILRCIGMFVFQSPSRWGRCCIRALDAPKASAFSSFSPLLDGDGVASDSSAQLSADRPSVSVPFSMGTVLHPAASSLDGRFFFAVSVPFSMGTVLHPFAEGCAPLPDFSCFSPLLDGDGVASPRPFIDAPLLLPFQSPSRWGRCCIARENIAGYCADDSEFQSPSRWGRCCIDLAAGQRRSAQVGFSPLLDGDGVASR